MRINSRMLLVLATAVVAGFFFSLGKASAESPAELPMRDDFDGKLTLDWETVRPDPTHVSLESHPGRLTITTQYGSIHQAQTTAKNLMFIEPPADLETYVITTCIEDFLPTTIWQQAGLMILDDEDNFIKWVFDYHSGDFPILNMHWEIDQKSFGAIAPVEVNTERFWLRVIKRGDQFQFLASMDDGKSFTTYGVIPWGDGSPKKIGLVAKNGPRHGDLEAQFDFFELREATEKELACPVFPLRRSLLGNWRAVERQVDGKPVTKGPDTLLMATPGKLTLKEKRQMPMAYTVDLTTDPHSITLIPRSHGVGPLLNGVFALDGDTLTLRLNPKLNAARPTSLEPKAGDGHLFLKFKREPTSTEM